MRKFFFFSFILISLFLLTACKPTVKSVEVVSDQTEFDESFQLSNLNVKVTYSNGDIEYEPFNESMLTPTELAKFQQAGTHTINFTYLNTAASFKITITGEKGDNGIDGREIELQVASGNIQWRYKGETTWKNLIALSSLTGATGSTGPTGQTGPQGPNGQDGQDGQNGQNGQNGDSITFQVANGYIQWKYLTGTTWYNLMDLASLKGAQGDDGTTPVITISDDGYWVINGIKTTYQAVADTKECTATFVLNNGTLPDGVSSTVTVLKGNTITLPIPTREGYIFKGWFSGDTINDAQFTNVTPVSKDMSIYAKWELDLEPIIQFINTFNSDNYTLGMNFLESLTNGTITEQTMMEGIYKLYIQNEIYYDYTSISVKGINELEPIFIDEIYSLYSEGAQYYLRLQPEAYLGYDYSNDLNQFLEFDYLDINKFTKREGSNIYDYPIDNEILKEMGIYYPNLTINSFEFYIDLTLQKIFFNIDAETTEENLLTQVSLTYDMTLSNIGTTLFEIPFETAKSVANNMIDRAASVVSLDLATNESINGFNQLVATIKNQVNSVTDFMSLVSMVNKFTDAIQNYQITIDPLKYQIKQAIMNLNDQMENIQPLITDDSYTAIEVIYDQYIIDIAACTNAQDISILVQQFNNEILELMVIDDTKNLVLYQKYHKIQNLYNIVEIYNSILLEPTQDLYWVIQNYTVQIENATSTSDIEVIYNNCLLELQNFNNIVLEDKKQNLINYFSYEYESFYNNYINEFGFSQEIYDSYLVNKPTTLEENILLVIQLIEGYSNLYNDVFVKVKENILAKGETLYNKYLNIAIDANIPALNYQYKLFIINTEKANEVYSFNSYSEFESFCFNLSVDPLKESKYNYTENLINEFNELKKYAYNDSILAMQAILDLYLPLISAAITPEEVYNVYIEASNELDNAYKPDYVKGHFANKKVMVKDKCLQTTNLLYTLFDQVDYMIIHNAFLYYSNLIENATTYEELNSIVSQWNSYLESYPFESTSEQLDNIKQNTIIIIQGDFSYVISKINFVPETILANYNLTIDNIKNATNIQALMEYYFNYFDYITAFNLQWEREQEIEIITSRYNYYKEIIIETDLASLDIAYQSCITRINNSLSTDDIYMSIYNFEQILSTFTIVPIKDSIYNYCTLLIENAGNLKIYATDESIINIDNIVSMNLSLLTASSTIYDVEITYSTALSEVQNAYVFDAHKYGFFDYKNKVNNNIYWMTYQITNLYQYSEFINVIHSIRNEYQEYIMNATTKAEVDQKYTDWYNRIITIDNRFIDGALEIAKLDVKATIEDDLSLLDYPTSLVIIKDSMTILIDQSTSVYEIYNIYHLFKMAKYDYILNDSKLKALVEIENIYNTYHQMVSDADIITLDAKYAEYRQIIENAIYEFEVSENLNGFMDYCYSLVLDPFKVQIYNTVLALQNEFDYLKLTATDASITTMEIVLITYIENIKSSTTSEEILNNYNTALVALKDAYIEEISKVILFNEKNVSIYWMDRLYSLLQLGFENYNDIMSLDLVYNQYYELIQAATTKEDVIINYNNWALAIQTNNYQLKPTALDSFVNQTIIELTNELTYLEMTVDQKTQYDTYIYQIKTSINLYDSFNYFVVCSKFLDEVSLNNSKTNLLNEITRLYNDFKPIVIDEQLQSVEDNYNVALTGLTNCILEPHLYEHYIDYYNFVMGLTIDSNKLTRLSYISIFEQEAIDLGALATTDSIVNMQIVVNNFVTAINLLTNEPDMITLKDEYYLLLLDAYVEDHSKFNLQMTKEKYILKLNCYQELNNNFPNDNYALNLDTINLSISQINEALTEIEVETIYNEAMTKVAYINMLIYTTVIESYRMGIAYYHMDNDYLTYTLYLDPIPIEITNEYQNIKNSILSAGDPFAIVGLYLNWYDGFINATIANVRLQSTTLLNNEYTNYISLYGINADLEVKFNKTIDFIINSNNLTGMDNMVLDFMDLLNFLTAKETGMDELEALYISYEPTATENSKIAMAEARDLYITNIQNSTTFDEVTINVTEGLNQINLRYEENIA